MIRVATIENRFEADLIAQTLEEEGVDYVIKTFHDTAYDGLYETVQGYGMLLVEESAEARAREIVAELRASVDAGEMEPESEEPEENGGEEPDEDPS